MALVKHHYTTVICKLKNFAIQEVKRAVAEHRSAVIPINIKDGTDYVISLSDEQLAALTNATMTRKASIKLKLSYEQLHTATPVEVVEEKPDPLETLSDMLNECLKFYRDAQAPD